MNTPVHGDRLSSFIHFAGGRRGCRGAPSNEALPCTPGKRTCIACAWAPSRAAGGALIFVHHSSHFVLRHSFVSDVARGRNLTPDGSSHFVLHAILNVWHTWDLHFIFSVFVASGPVCLPLHQFVPSQSVCRSGIPEMGPDHSEQKLEPTDVDDNANSAQRCGTG